MLIKRLVPLFVLLFIPSVLSSALTAPKAEATVSPVQVMDVSTLIKAQAERFALNEVHLDKTIECESQYNDQAMGDHGAAYGIAQFHRGTFDYWKNRAITKYGEPFENLQYEDPQDQITLMAFMWSHGQEHQWSCYDIEQAKNWK